MEARKGVFVAFGQVTGRPSPPPGRPDAKVRPRATRRVVIKRKVGSFGRLLRFLFTLEQLLKQLSLGVQCDLREAQGLSLM